MSCGLFLLYVFFFSRACALSCTCACVVTMRYDSESAVIVSTFIRRPRELARAIYITVGIALLALLLFVKYIYMVHTALATGS
jgi:hypothetical protein